MSFGGFLAMGNQYHPLPWSLLRYDTNVGGYVINLDKDQLKGSPLTRSAPNRRGAIALTKARYMTIAESDHTGPCDLTTASANSSCA